MYTQTHEENRLQSEDHVSIEKDCQGFGGIAVRFSGKPCISQDLCLPLGFVTAYILQIFYMM